MCRSLPLGRLATGALADRAIADGKTDLIGLARVLWADPQWPKKVRDGREADIIHCNPDCGDACMQMVMKGRPCFLCGLASGEDEGVEGKIGLNGVSIPRLSPALRETKI